MQNLHRLTRAEGESRPVALVLPGAGYTAQAPLLYWPIRALSMTGWDVWAVDWHERARTLSESNIASFVSDHVAEALQSLPMAPAAIIAKSLGTYALPQFASTSTSGVWLTPILTDERIAAAAREATSHHLLVGGSNDPSWTPNAFAGTSARSITISASNHSLERTDASWAQSAADQLALFDKIADHFDAAR